MTDYDPNSLPPESRGRENIEVHTISKWLRYVIDYDLGVVYVQKRIPTTNAGDPTEVRMDWNTPVQMTVETLVEIMDKYYDEAA